MFGHSSLGTAVATAVTPSVAKKIAMAPVLTMATWAQDCAKLQADLKRVVATDSGGQCVTWVPSGTFDYPRECATVHVRKGDEWRTIALNTFVNAYNRGGQPEVVALWTCVLQMILQETTLSEVHAKKALAPLVNQAEQMTRATRPAMTVERAPVRTTTGRQTIPGVTTTDPSLVPQEYETAPPPTTVTPTVTVPGPGTTAPPPGTPAPTIAPTPGLPTVPLEPTPPAVIPGPIPRPTPPVAPSAPPRTAYLIFGAAVLGVIGLAYVMRK